MLPTGWMAAGKAPEDYEMTLDTTQRHSGTRSAVIRSITDRPQGFGTLMQMFVPGDYRGKRVRMSGWVRSENVEEWCGLWMRVDGQGGDMLAFDNMQSRPIRGTTDWTRYEIVLDVAQESSKVAFGILLAGRGSAWLDDLGFEVVGGDVPCTGGRGLANAPRNLSFEE